MTALPAPVDRPGSRSPVLVHDYLLVDRGAERTFTALCDVFPGAPVRTLLFDQRVFGDRLAGHQVSTSPLQRLRTTQKHFKMLLPAFPRAAERLPVQGHDLVVSSSSAFAHGVRPDPGATHVCYCHTPFRYAWHERRRGLEQTHRAMRPVLARVLDRIGRWDRECAQRPTHFVANSRLTQDRIRTFWGRDAPVVHPPVDVARFRPSPEVEDFFLFIGELVRHKQVEVALEAAERGGHRIAVVGSGSDAARLADRYGHRPGVTFMGRVSDETLVDLLPRARALVVPNIEEFGIAAVEAQAAGRPVLAADGGGARETVVEGATGWFFPEGDVRALEVLMAGAPTDDVDPRAAVAHAEGFSVERFQSAMLEQIAEATAADRVSAPSLVGV